MHEQALTESLVNTATEIARKEGADKVLGMTVAVGAMSGVVASSVAFCFEFAVQGTVLEGAQLDIEEIPLLVKWTDCGAQSEPEIYYLRCLSCQSRQVEILTGKEFTITGMEVE